MYSVFKTLRSLNSLTTKFFQRKKKCMQKNKKNQDTRRDSNPRSRALELNALTTWLLYYIAILENYKTFITNLSKNSAVHSDVKRRLRTLKS